MFPGCLEHCNAEGTLSEYDRDIACQVKSFTKTLSFCDITLHEKGLISVFQELFDIINKIFILAGRLGTRPSIYEVCTFS